jgi:hypothetical protein
LATICGNVYQVSIAALAKRFPDHRFVYPVRLSPNVENTATMNNFFMTISCFNRYNAIIVCRLRQEHYRRGEDTERQSGSRQFANPIRITGYLTENQERLAPLDQDETERRHGGDEKEQPELAWTECPRERSAENDRENRHPDLTLGQVGYVPDDS